MKIAPSLDPESDLLEKVNFEISGDLSFKEDRMVLYRDNKYFQHFDL